MELPRRIRWLPLLLFAWLGRAGTQPCADLDTAVPGAERIVSSRVIRLGAPESEILLRLGWAVPERWKAQDELAVWADAPRSILTLPVAAPHTARITVRMSPYNCSGCPPQRAHVELNGRSIGEIQLLPGGFRDYTLDVPREAWVYHDDELSFRWSRLRSPIDEDPKSTDRRLLAAAVTRVTLLATEGGNLLPLAAKHEPSRVAGDEALALFFRVPPGARFEASARRDATSAFGASGTAVISVRSEGSAVEKEIDRRALSALSRTPRTFSIDLSPYASKVVRLSLRLHGPPDLFARWEDLRLCATDPFDAADAFGRCQPRPATVSRGTDGKRPDAIVYLMDALRARDLGCYGELTVTSPFLDRLSRDGVLLEENVSQASNTPPSVKALLTGKYLPLTSTSRLPDGVRTIGQAFADAGNRTAAFCNSPWPAFVDALRGIATTPRDLWYEASVPKTFASMLTDALLRWVGKDATPFFAYLHSIHPHNPYTPVAPWIQAIPAVGGASISGTTDDLLAYQHQARKLTEAELAELHRRYRLDILYNDHEISRLARGLGARWESTAFLLLADHGDELGEHHGILHGYTSYDEMVRVPAILHAPSLPRGKLVGGRTETIDLGPTLLDVAGLPPLPDADGRTLRPLIEGIEAPRRRVYTSASSAPGIYTIIDGDWKYVFAPRNGLEVGIGEGPARVRERFYLWNLRDDPEEKRNRVRDDPVLAQYLHQSLLSWLDSAVGPSPRHEEEIPPDVKAALKALGYLDEGALAPAQLPVKPEGK